MLYGESGTYTKNRVFIFIELKREDGVFQVTVSSDFQPMQTVSVLFIGGREG